MTSWNSNGIQPWQVSFPTLDDSGAPVTYKTTINSDSITDSVHNWSVPEVNNDAYGFNKVWIMLYLLSIWGTMIGGYKKAYPDPATRVSGSGAVGVNLASN
jgi:hypothetical protein